MTRFFGTAVQVTLAIFPGNASAEEPSDLDTVLPIRGFAIATPTSERAGDFLDQYFGRVPPVENEYGGDPIECSKTVFAEFSKLDR